MLRAPFALEKMSYGRSIQSASERRERQQRRHEAEQDRSGTAELEVGDNRL